MILAAGVDVGSSAVKCAVVRCGPDGHEILSTSEGRIRRLVEMGKVKRFVVPEINLGQLRREVERLTDLPVERLNHAVGKMPVPDEILGAILEHHGK